MHTGQKEEACLLLLVKAGDSGTLGNNMNTNTALVNETEDLPGDFAIWIFILAEMLVFGVMFIVYAFTRAHQLEVFNASQLTLSRGLGTLNTIILITSIVILWCVRYLPLN